MKRVSHPVPKEFSFTAESAIRAPPLAQLPSVYLVHLRPAAVALLNELPMVDESRRRLLPPGIYRVTSNIVLEAELSEKQLSELFIRQPAAPPLEAAPPEPAPPTENEIYKAKVKTIAAELGAVYEAKLGKGPPDLLAALGSWLDEFEPDALEVAIEQTRAARIPSTRERWHFLKEILRLRRRGRLAAAQSRGGR